MKRNVKRLKQFSNKALFEGFVLQIVDKRQVRKVKDLIRNELSGVWSFKRFGEQGTDFELTSKRNKLTIPEVWKVTYRLRSLPGLVYVEPMFALHQYQNITQSAVVSIPPAEVELEAIAASAFSVLSACLETQHLPESDEHDWSLKEINAFQAYQDFFPDSLPGEKILVGHPDTGYWPHPEILPNLATDRDHDFIDDDDEAQDGLDEGFLLFPGHGTGTASVIISRHEGSIFGVAPGTKLMPLRISRSVVLDPLSALKLAHAIEYAADNGAHVISMSLGLVLFSWRVKKAVRYAQKKGVIVCAAAGNCVGFVTWPAAYDEVIAVAASNARREIWQGSCRGEKVDVTAPGESVWRAEVIDRNSPRPNVDRGSGTSYAVATVAGIAALWLSYHGRDSLIARYGAEKVPFVFNQILRANCTIVPGWDPRQFGAGLVNTWKTLNAPLPGDLNPVTVAPAIVFNEHDSIDRGELETFAHLFERQIVGRDDVHLRKLISQLASLLNTTEQQLPGRLREIGQELAFHLVVNPDLYQQFAGILESEESPAMAESAAERPQMADLRDKLLQRGVSVPLGRKMQE